MLFFFAACAVGLLSFLGLIVHEIGRLRGSVEELGRFDGAARLAQLEVKVEALPSIWEDHEHRARKAFDRARYTLRELEKRTAASEAEPELPGLDGSSSNGEGMHAVHQPMADNTPAYLAAGWRANGWVR